MALIQHTEGQSVFSGKTASRELSASPKVGNYLLAVCGASPVRSEDTYSIRIGDTPFTEIASRNIDKDYGPGLSLMFRKIDGTEQGLVSGSVSTSASNVYTALWVGEFDQLPSSLLTKADTTTSTSDLDRVLSRPTGMITGIQKKGSLVLAAWMTQQQVSSPSIGGLTMLSDSHLGGWVNLIVGYRYKTSTVDVQESLSWSSPKTTATSVIGVFEPGEQAPVTNTPPVVDVIDNGGTSRTIKFTVTIDIP